MSEPHNLPAPADYLEPPEADDQRGAVAYQVTTESEAPQTDYLTEEEIKAMTTTSGG